jgi:hypothetical protein
VIIGSGLGMRGSVGGGAELRGSSNAQEASAVLLVPSFVMFCCCHASMTCGSKPGGCGCIDRVVSFGLMVPRSISLVAMVAADGSPYPQGTAEKCDG